MTRSFFKGLAIRALVVVVLSLSFLLVCYYKTKSDYNKREQAQYQEEFGSLLMASEYRLLNTSILKDFQDIRYVYSAYDESGKLIGYILDVAMDTSYGFIHTQLCISENGENLMDLRIVEDKENAITLTEEQLEELKSQLKDARIPVAVNQQLVPDVPYQVEYDPLLGLHDGIYYSELPEVSKDGYLDYVEIEVRGGRIVRVEWDAVNATTKKTRSQDSINGDYNISGNIWAEQAYRVQNRLVLVQDPMKLAMKSDGTTEIIDGVTMKISVFVQLVNESIANSRSMLTKDMYLRSKNPESSDPNETDPETKEDVKETTTETDGNTSETTLSSANTPTPMPTVPATPTPTKVPSQIGVVGGEDGVVQGDTGDILSESVDGIPLSEIRTYIEGLPDAQNACSATLSTINQAYKFMREYLNWVG